MATPVTVTLGRDTDQKELLQYNLCRFGYSTVRILNCDVAPPTQDEIRSCFVSNLSQGRDIVNNNDGHRIITYISSESGATNDNVEPKESYEVKLEHCLDDGDGSGSGDCNDDDIDTDNTNCKGKVLKIKQWCRAMSWIAEQVVAELDIPPNTFLQETRPKPSSTSPSSISTAASKIQSLDLLRVFHYFPVEYINGNIEDRRHNAPPLRDVSSSVLGSSPHTDWGSLTIVWQDHVGGLQTYCRDSCQWVDVPSPSPPPPSTIINDSEPDTTSPKLYCWDCIVHVGDISSLVLGRAYSNNNDERQSLSATKTDVDGSTMNIDPQSCCWPSPKHRVVNSSTQYRTSLVFFGYPPADKSLDDIESSLKEWKQHHQTGKRLPYEEYYLLQDQSAAAGSGINEGSSSRPNTPEQTYESIRYLPISDVIQKKWLQVQR